ncbi:methyltransferase family protein [Falsiroseomonas sp.]|uniref:methyltransferase family protein n=1 Tax=Falsiroseomonas sp. TaxID=2870721 RepID=UPI003564AAA8
MSVATNVQSDPRAMALDLAERVIVSLLLGFLAMRFIPSIVNDGNVVNLLLFVSEAVVVGFIVFRRPAKTISRNSSDWLYGFAGTGLALLAVPGGEGALAPAGLVVGLMTAGFLLQFWAKLVLRRSFGVVAANRGVKASGPYRLVRHPMYAGYLLTHIGFLLAAPALWNVAVYAALWCFQLLRIRAEERVLREDPAYLALSAQVRHRLIPGVY